MKISVTNEAARWYINEIDLKKGDRIRFFVRYGGCSTVQSGFSLGINQDEPFEIGVETTVEGILFFIEEKDLWYFSDHDLIVSFDLKLNEPVFEYSKEMV